MKRCCCDPYWSTANSNLTPSNGYHVDTYTSSIYFGCDYQNAELYHCLWSCPTINSFGEQVCQFTSVNLTNFLPSERLWKVFGYMNPEQYPPLTSQIWLQSWAPLFKLVLDKLSFLLKLCWESFIALLPLRIKDIQYCFQPTVVVSAMPALGEHIKCKSSGNHDW